MQFLVGQGHLRPGGETKISLVVTIASYLWKDAELNRIRGDNGEGKTCKQSTDGTKKQTTGVKTKA